MRPPVGSVLNAWLRSDIPPALRVGGGGVLAVDGYFKSAGEVVEMEARVGDTSVTTLVHGVAPPGEVVGSDWWSALIPVPSADLEMEVEVALRARLANGQEAEVVVGRTRILPLAAPSSPDAPEGELVCICMATYNPDPELLHAQVESIRAQDHKDWTCVISDDASSPPAVEAITRIADQDERFVLIRNETRRGFYRNFERALTSVPAAARYVALADQDDRWHPDKLSALISGLGESSLLVHSDARIVDAEGHELAPTFWPSGAPGDDRLEDLLFANTVTGASCMFRRSLLERALPFPALAGDPYHDRWLALAAAASGRIGRVERPLYDYVQHPGAVLGHARAAGVRASRPASIAQRLSKLRSQRPNWRRAHDSVLARSVSEAIVLRLRFGTSMSSAARRAVDAVEHLPSSRSSALMVARRHAMRAPRRAPGLEGALLRGLAWRALAQRRAKRWGPSGNGIARSGDDGQPRINEGRTRIGITVTEGTAEAGFGDFYTATELGSALSALGHDVVLLELLEDRWRDTVADIDVLVSLHDRIPLLNVPGRVRTAAWIRNWADRWAGRPWFHAYDVVFASSQVSVDRIRDRAGREALLMPLATNPDRFRAKQSEPRLRSDAMFAGNHWGGERLIADVLPRIAGGFDLKVFGHGWGEVAALAPLSAGPLAYEELPAAYSSTALVIDDSAPHARPYGAVNSRVFDALACGVPVASNDEAGVRAIFGEDFPVWSDAPTLESLVREAVEEPARLRALAAKYRDLVLERHTYAHRARQLVDALALT